MSIEGNVKIEKNTVKYDSSTSEMNKNLILDINEVPLTRNGIPGFYWPVSPFEISDVYLVVLRGVISVLREALLDVLPGINAGIVLYSYFIQEVMSSYEAHLLISRSQNNGYTITHPNRHPWVASLLTGNALPSFLTLNQLLKAPPLPKLWRTPLRFIRDIIVAPQEGMIRRSLVPINYQKNIISIRTDRLVASYAKNIKEKVYFRRFNTWFKCPDSKKVPSYKNYDELIHRLLESVNTSIFLKGEKIPEKVNTCLAGWLKAAIPLVECYYHQIDKNKKHVPKRLWVGTAGELWGKILGRYVKNHGGHVTRYSHGAGCGYFSTSIEHGVYDFEDCDTYVVFSKNQATALKNAFTGKDIVQETFPEIIHVDAHLFNTIAPAKKKSANKKKTIMYVSSIYINSCFYAASKGHMRAYVLLDWEARLINKIREWKWDVLLKPHPVESLSVAAPVSINDLFGPIILTKRFEEVYDQGDVILIDNPQTSLFSTLLISGKPFVYIDFGTGEFSDHAYDLLEKRCPIVKAWYDKTNRAQVDWDLLNKAIETCHEYSNDEFAKYYFQ